MPLNTPLAHVVALVSGASNVPPLGFPPNPWPHLIDNGNRLRNSECFARQRAATIMQQSRRAADKAGADGFALAPQTMQAAFPNNRHRRGCRTGEETNEKAPVRPHYYTPAQPEMGNGTASSSADKISRSRYISAAA
jgi:hypothetical protein